MKLFLRVPWLALGLLAAVVVPRAAAQTVQPLLAADTQTPIVYPGYESGTVRLRIEAKVIGTDSTGNPPYYRLELVEDTLGARLDDGKFEWQPTYLHEGRTWNFRVRAACESCPGPPQELRFTVRVPAVQTAPRLLRPRLLSMAPNQERTVRLEVAEPSGQPVRLVAVSSNATNVAVRRGDHPLELIVQTSAAANGRVLLRLTLDNSQDRVQVEAEIPLALETVQYPPVFTGNQRLYRTTEGTRLTIDAPATDRNLDPILYSWEEVEPIETGATFALTDPRRGTYQFLATDLGDADMRVARYNLTASDGFVTVSKPITIEVRRAISRETEANRRAAFQKLVLDYGQLIDSCQATLSATQRMIRRRNWFNKGADIALFSITLGAALATNLAAPGSDIAKASSILSAVGAGLVALIKVNLSTEEALRSSTLALQAELITAQKRLQILYGGERLSGFVLGSAYQATMDDYLILLESARTRFRLSYTNLSQERRIQKILNWRDESLRARGQ